MKWYRNFQANPICEAGIWACINALKTLAHQMGMSNQLIKDIFLDSQIKGYVVDQFKSQNYEAHNPQRVMITI